MKTLILCSFLTVLMFVSTVSCSKESENATSIEESGIQQEQVAQQPVDGAIVLGKEINDPYAIHNIKAAYSNLKSAGGDIPVAEVQPNKKYLRFLPANEDEWALLKRDSTLLLFDFPLNYEIEVSGSYYHDPTLPDTAITWQYCVVPIDWPIPAVKHELLYEVFIPEEPAPDAEVSIKRASAEGGFYDNLLYESYKMTGNIEAPKEGESQTKGWFSDLFKPDRWNPQGTIKVYDEVRGVYIGLEGANVHARWSTHVESAITDVNGYFRTGSFIYNVNYAIKWDRYDYSIRSGTAGQAWYNGPKMEGDWNLYIGGGTKQSYYATIHRAALHYYYGNIGNLTHRPPGNTFWRPQMKIAAIDEVNKDRNGRHNQAKRFLGILNWIKIWNPQDYDAINYATVIHELAHATHWNRDNSAYNDSETIVQESWANGVEWYLTKMIYPGKTGGYRHGDYTGIVEDMVDWDGSENDYVGGYTMTELESSILYQTTWDGWKNNIINNYDNGTEWTLPALFTFWAIVPAK